MSFIYIPFYGLLESDISHYKKGADKFSTAHKNPPYLHEKRYFFRQSYCGNTTCSLALLHMKHWHKHQTQHDIDTDIDNKSRKVKWFNITTCVGAWYQQVLDSEYTFILRCRCYVCYYNKLSVENVMQPIRSVQTQL